MKSAERELLELERKRQAQGDLNNAAAGGNNVKSSASEITRLKIKEIAKQIEDDTKKLALVRAQVKKLKSTAVADSASKRKSNAGAGASVEEVTASGNDDDGKDAVNKKAGGKDGATGATRGGISTPLPETLYPQLCRYVIVVVILIYMSQERIDCVFFMVDWLWTVVLTAWRKWSSVFISCILLIPSVKLKWQLINCC